MSNLGNKQIMASNIRSHLDSLGLNAKDFSNRLDFKYSTVLDWLNAKTYPRIDKIEKMANYFGVEKSDLVEDKGTNELPNKINSIVKQLNTDRQQNVVAYSSNQLKEQLQEENTKVISIKEAKDRYQTEYPVELLGYVSAGTGEYLQDWKPEEILVDNTPDVYDYALKVNGDSMEPLFADGQIIFVIKVTSENLFDLSNRIVIADFNGDAYVKKLVITHEELRLVSLNKEYEDKIVTEDDDFKVTGIVVL